MSWKEIKKSINSNLNTPLNEFFDSLSNQQKSLLSGISNELNNSTYGLQAIKNSLGSSGSRDSKPFYTSGLKTIFNDNQFSASTLPYNFCNGDSVVYNDEIHIFGGFYDKTAHYKWNGTSWTKVSTLHYIFTCSPVVVYNNEIHILGGNNNGEYYNYHYKWNGLSWSSVSTLPYNFCSGCAVVYNNEIHILGNGVGSSYYTLHYKWNGTSWTKVSTLPYNFYQGSAVVYNNEIHILGTYNNSNETKHYKWDGLSWSSVSTLPYKFYNGCAVVISNKIHILGGNVDNTGHYMYDGTLWTSVSTLPYNFYQGSAVIYNGRIHILGGSNGTIVNLSHYKLESQYRNSVFLPQGKKIFIQDTIPGDIVAISNCTKQEDGSLLVDSDGLVEFDVYDVNPINYSIF